MAIARLGRFLRDEHGAAAIDYAVMTSIAVAIIAIVASIGGELREMFQSVYDGFNQ